MHWKERPGLDLTRSKTKRPLGGSYKDLQKLISCLVSRLNLPKPNEAGIDPYLLPKFPMSGLFITLPGINMTCRTRAPEVGMVLLPRGSLLKKKLSTGVNNPDVNGPMP